MNIPSGYRPVVSAEVQKEVTKELELIVMAAATMAHGNEAWTIPDAINTAYKLFDEAVKQGEKRLETAIFEETRRRRGW